VIDDLVRLRIPGEVQISPDGRHAVYVEKRTSLEKNRDFHALVLVELESGRSRALTAGDHSDRAPTWTPDSAATVFVSDRGSGSNLWRTRLDGGEAEQLTQLDGRLSAPCVSPDGRRVAFIYAPKSAQQRLLQAGPEHPGPRYRHLTRLSYKLDGHGHLDGAFMHLWVLDLRTRKVRRLTSGAHHDNQPTWSPNGRQLAFVSNRVPRADLHVENSDIYIVPAGGGAPRALTRQRGPKFAPSWSPDGKSIAYIGHHRYPDTVENLHVWVVPLRGGAERDLLAEADLMGSNLCISDIKDVPEGSAPTPLWSANGRRIRFLASVEGSVNVYEVAAQGGQPVALSHGHHEISELSQNADGRRWALLRIDPTSPGDLWCARFGSRARPPAARGLAVTGAQLTRVTRLHTAFRRGKQVAKPREFHLRCREGHAIHGWVLHAHGRARKAPTILMLHGGPHAMYGWSFFHEFQMLAAAGYHVVYTNIRGSVGYGNNFMRAIVGKWGHEDYKDVTAVTDWIESRPWADPERLAIAGGSYGGFMTNWAIGHTRRFKCAITMRSVVDMVSFYGSSDMGWVFHQEFGAHPWEAHERYWRVSPLAFVDRIRTPLLILHADEDHRCPVSQGEELFVALKVLNRDVEMVRFLGEGHGLSRSGRPHNRLERLRRILDWLERKL
jgi:dipeptidyl aminopeptidase/acylaminoacyl peptidase